MVFTLEHRRFIIESYFRNSAFNNQDFFSDGNSSLEFGVHFYLDRNSCAGLKGLCPSPGIKYYADGNSCAPVIPTLFSNTPGIIDNYLTVPFCIILK
jgi:hypothetical protein